MLFQGEPVLWGCRPYQGRRRDQAFSLEHGLLFFPNAKSYFPDLICTNRPAVFPFRFFIVLIDGTSNFNNTVLDINTLQADQLARSEPNCDDEAISVYKPVLARLIAPSAHRTGEQFFDIAGLYGLLVAFRRIIGNFDFLRTKSSTAISAAIFQEAHHRITDICEHLPQKF